MTHAWLRSPLARRTRVARTHLVGRPTTCKPVTLFRPSETPRFGLAARSLVLTLQQQLRVEDRAAELRQLSRDLGDSWFPFYLKMLMVVGEGAPEDERAMVADAAAHGLQYGQPAAGTLSSWGIPSPLPAAVAAAAGQGFLRMAAARPLDPLAYIVVWFGQSTSRPLLPQAAFERALIALLRLFNASASAVSIYQAKLRADLATATDGTFSMATVTRMQTLLDGWTADVTPLQLASDVAAAGHLPPARSGEVRAWPRPFV
jgi:hypothetical protein